MDAVEALSHVPILGDPPGNPLRRRIRETEKALQTAALAGVVDFLNRSTGDPSVTEDNVHELIQQTIRAHIARLPWHHRLLYAALVLEERVRGMYACARGRRRNVRWTS